MVDREKLAAYPVRECRTMHDCCLCPNSVLLGERYHDGGRRAHVECVAEEPEDGDVARCCVCGCTDEYGCDGGCSWVAADLCSACDGRPAELHAALVDLVEAAELVVELQRVLDRGGTVNAQIDRARRRLREATQAGRKAITPEPMR